MAKITPMRKKKAGATPAKPKVEEKPVQLVEDDDSEDMDDDDDLLDDDVSDIDDADLEDADDGGDDDDADDDDDDDEDDDEDGEDDDDDKEDADEDDDDDEEGESPSPKKTVPLLVKAAANANNNAKGANKKTPVKNEKPQSPAAAKKRQHNTEAEPPAKKVKVEAPKKMMQSKADQDKISLFVKGFPEDTTDEMLKELSPDIVDVRRKRGRYPFAFLQFESEELTDKNYKILQKAKIGDSDLFVDYAGSKATNKPMSQKPQNFQEKNKLFVGGLNPNTTEDEVREAFPDSTEVAVIKGKTPNAKSFAFVSFDSEDKAKNFVDTDVTVGNQQVQPRIASSPRSRGGGDRPSFNPRNKPFQGRNQHQQHRVKFVKKNNKNYGSD